MKYKTALFWLGLAAVAGGVLFETSYDVQELEEQLASLNRKIVQEQEAIQVLKAEWSFLNDPSRLESLARAHLNLGPTDARQFVASIEALPFRSQPAAPDTAPALPPMAGLNVMPANYVPPGYRPTVQAAAPAVMVMPAAATVVPAAARPSGPMVAAAPAPAAEPPVRAEPAVVKPAPVRRPPAKPTAAVAKPAPRPAAPAAHDSIGVMIARLGGTQ
ncbi:cell division protein FtsL [Azospirillum sp. ST 5-10]|uniref:cell division protein FtsL n=1 Tax=unclassified Azospirillum TaxID=2630922 RepID=UPI003F4A70A8